MPTIAGVIGSPVGHSLSPAIHNAAFRAARLDWAYAAFEVPAGQAVAALDAMRTLGLGGLSVTTPHKVDVSTNVDELAPAAAALMSVNTVVRSDDGRLIGHSTDGDGFVDSLSAAGIDVAQAVVAVIGAGAAARSVIDALGRAGAASIAVVNRSAERAASAASLADVATVGSVDDIADAAIVVNATSLGMGAVGDDDADLPFDTGVLGAGQVVADLVYHPLTTPLLRRAGAAGCVVVDGLGMLIHQAVLQQQLWTGRRPDPAVMRIAAMDELARRRAGDRT